MNVVDVMNLCCYVDFVLCMFDCYYLGSIEVFLVDDF